LGPTFDHGLFRPAGVDPGVNPVMLGVPVDRGDNPAVAELLERHPLGPVDLAEVVGQAPHVVGVPLDQGAERPAWADGA
jgi:hypothetical protein